MVPSVNAIKAQAAMFRLIDEHFDAERGSYAAGYDDARIAKESGLALAMVTAFRREGFGKLRETPDLASIRADVASIRKMLWRDRGAAGQGDRRMSAIITLQMLLDESACKAQVEKFRELFGESVNVTVAEARKVADKFDWRFAVRFLDAEGRADYERVTGPAWADYRARQGPGVGRLRARQRRGVGRVRARHRPGVGRVRARHRPGVGRAPARRRRGVGRVRERHRSGVDRVPARQRPGVGRVRARQRRGVGRVPARQRPGVGRVRARQRSALAEYRRVEGAALAECERVKGPAWADYERARGAALAEYERVTGPAWTEYQRVTGPAWASAYIATCARRKAVRVVA